MSTDESRTRDGKSFFRTVRGIYGEKIARQCANAVKRTTLPFNIILATITNTKTDRNLDTKITSDLRLKYRDGWQGLKR